MLCSDASQDPTGCGRTQALLWETWDRAQLSADPHGGPAQAIRSLGLLPRDVTWGREMSTGPALWPRRPTAAQLWGRGQPAVPGRPGDGLSSHMLPLRVKLLP